MTQWLAYPAYAATGVSILYVTGLTWRENNLRLSKNVSALALKNDRLARYFRLVLAVCGTLFAVSMYGYVLPKVQLGSYQTVAWTLTYLSALLLVILPAEGKTFRWHNVVAKIMATGMLGSATIFAFSLPDTYALACRALTAVMAVLVLATFVDDKRFIVYETLFIFLAHISIVLAVVSIGA